MSRMHDALKKAEEERVDKGIAAGTETTVPPTPPESSSFFDPPMELHRLLLERCPRFAWNPDRKTLLSFDRRNRVVGLEEFRTLRSHLYLIRDRQRQLQKLLIASALPLEGKTFVAANLAQVIVRQHERRVLLVDADLRLSRMHLSLGAQRTPGLSDYLAGEADEFSVIRRGPLDNLFFIPGGKSVPNPSELIGTGRLKLLLDRLAPAFDWVILDSPPVIPVSDAKLLADFCDGVLVVIRAGVTPFDLAQKACQEFREKHLLGVVLNRVKPRDGYSSYYYEKQSESKKNSDREDSEQ